MLTVCLQIAVCCLPWSPPEGVPGTYSGECMGTTWQVRVHGDAQSDLQTVIQDQLDQVDRLMSNWRPDSEVSRFNAYQGTEWFAVSPETVEVLAAALEVSQATDGAFDVTVSPLIALWNFGPDLQKSRVPSDSQIRAVRDHVGWRKLEVRRRPPAVRKQHPRVEVNLSAIAKGFAVDQVAAALVSRGLDAWLVEVGGEVRAQGLSPRGRPWTIGVEEPIDQARKIHSAVPLENQAMATSGDYRNFFVVDGKRYSHTIDPRTGRPVEHGLASVSVLAANCMRADAWATAITVLGPDSGTAMARQQGLSALLLVRTSTGFESEIVGQFPAEPEESAATGSNLVVFGTALAVFLLAIVGMAIGVIISNKRLKGSCGGLAGMTDATGKTACDLCAIPSPECRGEQAEQAPAAAEPTADSGTA